MLNLNKMSQSEIQTAYTNRGHLMPCCYCDEEWATLHTLKD